MEVIIFEEESFYKLIDELVKRVNNNQDLRDKWVDDVEAQRLLKCKKTKLWSLRSNGLIRFSQPSRKIILYDRDSIMEYLDKNAKSTF